LAAACAKLAVLDRVHVLVGRGRDLKPEGPQSRILSIGIDGPQ
jgi:hypothetical protein